MVMLFSVRIVDLGGNTGCWILGTGKYYPSSVPTTLVFCAKGTFGNAAAAAFLKNLIFFFTKI